MILGVRVLDILMRGFGGYGCVFMSWLQCAETQIETEGVELNINRN
jgi:hypothetical protein